MFRDDDTIGGGLAGYMGAKSGAGVYQTIIARMPPHDTYIETHLGTGVVMQRKPQARRSIAVERDPATLAAFAPIYPVELVEGDCVAFLERFDFAAAGRVLVYADPPYLDETRTSQRRYRFDYTRKDHERLLAALRELPAAVILSGYPSALYDQALPGWRTHEFQAMTRGGVRTEKLWMNFEAGAVHWARFAGRNFTDRQRIKRKAERWAARYRALPPAERVAVLAALLDVDGEGEAPAI